MSDRAAQAYCGAPLEGPRSAGPVGFDDLKLLLDPCHLYIHSAPDPSLCRSPSGTRTDMLYQACLIGWIVIDDAASCILSSCYSRLNRTGHHCIESHVSSIDETLARRCSRRLTSHAPSSTLKLPQGQATLGVTSACIYRRPMHHEHHPLRA